MVVANRDRVRTGLDLLKKGLVPFVEREFLANQGEEWIEQVCTTFDLKPRTGGGVGWDVGGLMKAMADFWRPVFRHTLGHAERSYVSLIREVRNRWAHEEPFTSDEVYRALDQMQLLLQSVSAHDEAEELGKQKAELQRQVFQAESRNKTRYTPTFEGMVSPNLKPWREIVTPHKDVASGNYMQAEFAADLAQVHKGEGSDEYGDPAEFFRRTYITEGMKDLLDGALRRLDGKEGDPVVELQTNFGGGKTHSMLALYHLFSGVDAGALAGMEPVLKEAGVSSPAKANRAVLVGTALSPAEVIKKDDGTAVRTLWGEMAWQLGGREAFELVAKSDVEGTSPGSDVLAKLFQKCSPCLVLIDEWVAYARQIVGKDSLPSGGFDAQASFAQALTEAAAQAQRTLVVASIPASRIEIGGEHGENALDVLKNVFERVGKPWRPAGGDEGFEIVRRRLFEPIEGKEAFALRDAVVEDFVKMYSKNEGEFPLDCRESDYREKMRGSYPLHPELFRRLYDDWSTLDRFQRTRGVLRLLAKVIHRLWESEDKALLILPASIPMDDGAVKSELTRYLSDPWEPIISKDVDGPDSMPLALDKEVTNLGRLAAARRVARTLYIGTAPGSDSTTPGIGAERVLLGCAQPGESLGTFSDALRRISDQGQNIHQDGNRYWISTKPNLNRTAAAKASQLLREPEELHAEIVSRLRSDRTRGAFAGVHVCPDSSTDVPDEPKSRLVVLGPAHSHKRGRGDSPARQVSKDCMESRGGSPRINRNALVFLAPDEKAMGDLMAAAAHYLAWKEIHDRWESYNLDAFQKNQAQTKTKEFDNAINLRIGQTWIHALSPTQPSPTEPIGWDEVKVTGTDSLAARTAEKLTKDELLLPQMGGTRLRMELDRNLWKELNHVSLGELSEWFPRYLYLPRVVDQGVLERAILDGSSLINADDAFAVADGYDEAEQRYIGLRIAQAPGALSAATLLVKPEVASAQQAEEVREKPAGEGYGSDGETSSEGGSSVGGGDGGNPPAVKAKVKTFVGTVNLKALRMGSQVGAISEEVIQHLSVLPGARVKATLELQIEVPDGVSDEVIRTVSENAKTLGFDHASFEE